MSTDHTPTVYGSTYVDIVIQTDPLPIGAEHIEEKNVNCGFVVGRIKDICQCNAANPCVGLCFILMILSILMIVLYFH